MNHLRDLLDTPDYLIERDAGLPEADALAVLREARSTAERAICFWLGDIDGVVALTVIPELCRLPYPVCWFETEVSPKNLPGVLLYAGMLAIELADGSFAGLVFARVNGTWALVGSVHAARLSDVEMTFQVGHDDAKAEVSSMVYAVKAFLSALHCSNVERIENAPAAKLQKARSRRGKAPLYSYWTLQLDGKSERGEHQGGTHAGPRVHLRRGHPREYRPGKYTWVQAHAVGNRAAGMVQKDYRAGAGLLGAQP